MYRFIFCTVVLLVYHCNLLLSHNSSLAKQTPSVIAHSPPNTFVNDTVNVIEGNFFFSAAHLSMPGNSSLPFIQYYNNQSNYSSWLGTGMTLNYSFWMQGQSDSDKSDDTDNKYALMLAEAPTGSIIRCLGKTETYHSTKYYYLDPAVIHEGLTNCGSHEISGRTNLKNCYIQEKIKNNSHADWTSYLPDGTIKEYYRANHKEDAMNVKIEKRPNRTKLEYDYHLGYSSQNEGSAKRITAKGKRQLHWLRFDISKNDHEGTVCSSNGKKVTFKYFKKDGEEYIEEIDSSENPKIKFHYSKAGDLYCIDQISWPHGRFLEVEYDHKGRVKCQKAPVGPDGQKRTIWHFSYHPDEHYTKVHDANDNKRLYRYKSKRLTALEEFNKKDKLYRAHTYYWGEKKGLSWGKQPKTDEGNLIAEAILDDDDKAHIMHRFSYDDYGNVTKETLYGYLSGTKKNRFAVSSGEPKDSHIEHYSKHYIYTKKLHLRLTESEDDGPTINYRYKKDSDLLWAKLICDGNKIVKREFYKYDNDGILINKIVDNGTAGNRKSLTGVTQRLITEILPVRDKEGYGNSLPEEITESYLDLHSGKKRLIKRTKYHYNKAGLVTEQQVYDANNHHRYTLKTEYDGMGRIVRYFNELGQEFSYNYDENSNKDYEKLHGAGFYTKYSYDKVNRLIAEKEIHDDGTECTISYEYDLMGNKTASYDRYGNKTFYEYDEYNRLKRITLPPVDHGSGTNVRHTIEKEYDIFDNVVKETNQDGATTTYCYTSRRQPTLVTYADGSQERFEYNKNGTLADKWDRMGTKTSYKYDHAGRIIEITKPDKVTLYHAYDPLGRLVHLSSSDGTVAYTYSYDLHNNPLYVRDEFTQFVTKRTYDAWDRVTSDSTDGRFGFSYTYDPLGRLTMLTAPDGSSAKYLYHQGRLSKIERYSISGALRYEHSYNSFDLCDNVLESNLIANAGTLRYSWDKKGRLEKIDSPHFRQEIPSDGFDAVGNLKKCSFTDAIGEVLVQASYDDLYQLTEEGGIKTHTYKNDSLNNRRQKDAKQYALDGQNKLLSDSEEQFSYDKNGNLLEICSEHRKISFAYDALDRLIKVTYGQEVTSYQYDSFHRRIGKTIDQKTVHYLHFGQREIGFFDPATSTITEFRVLALGKGAELGASLSIELNNTLYCPIHDHRGNIVALVDPTTSKVKESYRYTAFGEREIYDESGSSLSASKVHNPWGFASKRHDPETGFVYFSRRYYAPETGRWVTPDPLGFADGPNLYAYVHNNPLTRFDLYGLFCEDEDDQNLGTRFLQETMVIYAQNQWAAIQTLASFGSDLVLHPIDTTQGLCQSARNGWEYVSNLTPEQVNEGIDNLKNALVSFVNNADTFTISAHVTAECLPGIDKLTKCLRMSKVAEGSGKVLNIINKETSVAKKAGIAKNHLQQKTGRAKNHLEPYKPIKPNEPAPGHHSTFRRNPLTGEIDHYATWQHQTNPKNPASWELVKRYDGPKSAPHYNKNLGMDIESPHVHDPHFPGEIRPAKKNEIPKIGEMQ